MGEARTETFHWTEAHLFLSALVDQGFTVDPKGRTFRSAERVCTPPLVVPVPSGCASLAAYVEQLPQELGRHLVVLMQAGAVSIGLFEDGEAVATKSFKRYVVRGSGRAQPTHLAQKGKSRYGSRLRLQNARRLLEETNEKLLEWEAELGPAERVFYSAPVRLWPSLFEARVPPPFERDGPLVRIPRDLPRPTTDVLLRAYRGLCYGRLENAERG